MNKLLIISLLSVITFTTCYFSISHDKAFVEFQNFMKKYNKQYSSIEEFQQKFEVFKRNIQTLDHYQLSTFDEEGQPMDYELGVTSFFDMSQEEFAKTYLNLNLENAGKILLSTKSSPFKQVKDDAPESFDWREYNAVSPVKNQGSCGSCWAFSATGNLEGQYALKEGNSLVEFSEQQLVDCDDVDQGCNGGLMESAYQFLEKEGGIMLSKDYPYHGKREKCQFNQSKVAAKISEYKYAGSEDEEQIKQFLFENGPLAIALNATPLQFYFGGVFDLWIPKFLCNPEGLNHGVLIVGYGVNEKGKKYWIVKNSWGSKWGEKGYFRIVRGKGLCGVNKYVITAKLE